MLWRKFEIVVFLHFYTGSESREVFFRMFYSVFKLLNCKSLRIKYCFMIYSLVVYFYPFLTFSSAVTKSSSEKYWSSKKTCKHF